MSINIAVFASGKGSNAEKIIEYFNNVPNKKNIRVNLIVSNKAGAGVFDIAKKNNIPTILLDKEKFFRGDAYIVELKAAQVDFIVLAGFLWKVPLALVGAYSNKILNIHPALLPKYGGKGMYGNFVHEAVIAARDQESGITIHVVDELYDHGHHIFQAICPVLPDDTPETLANRIHKLEHASYPRVIEEFIGKMA
ncbi:MAG TPA: phosphoribosylglycinamide formyltransferase [Chitinophagaceae bacterium]|nr:phosphoribosylglycinamide formyltransferase [Chitinophagaceae bacterium]